MRSVLIQFISLIEPLIFYLQSFCLSHTKYVTSLVEADQWLLSAGGDGLVKLWDPVSGDMLSEVACSDDAMVIQQLIYLNDSKTVVCLLNNSRNLVYVNLKVDGKTATFDHEVTEHSLPAEGLAMCQVNGGILVLVNDKSKPLHFIAQGQRSEPASLCKINDYLQSHWESFEGTLKIQSEFFTNLTKMNIDNVEEEMERKGKRVNTEKDKTGAKIAKAAPS